MSAPDRPSESRPSSFQSFSVSLCRIFPIFSWNILVRATMSGSGMYTRFSNLLRMALSSCHGILVAPSTNRPLLSDPTCVVDGANMRSVPVR